MNQNGERKYPGKLTGREKEWLNYLLPEGRKSYAEYREKISSMLIIGEGRFGEGNYVLGFEGDKPDLSYSSLPVFACGQIKFKECVLQISVHEIFDNKIEISIGNVTGEKIPDALTEISRWSYSYWKPGSSSPFANDKLREINITRSKGEIVLALSPKNYSVWLYEAKTEINHIIPVTNFINELLRGNKSVDKSKGIDIAFVFSHLGMFTDSEFVRAIVQYNKQWRKLELPDTEVITRAKRRSVLRKLFSRSRSEE